MTTKTTLIPTAQTLGVASTAVTFEAHSPDVFGSGSISDEDDTSYLKMGSYRADAPLPPGDHADTVRVQFDAYAGNPEMMAIYFRARDCDQAVSRAVWFEIKDTSGLIQSTNLGSHPLISDTAEAPAWYAQAWSDLLDPDNPNPSDWFNVSASSTNPSELAMRAALLAGDLELVIYPYTTAFSSTVKYPLMDLFEVRLLVYGTPSGQLHVNLSQVQDSPNWVSVCAISGETAADQTTPVSVAGTNYSVVGADPWTDSDSNTYTTLGSGPEPNTILSAICSGGPGGTATAIRIEVDVSSTITTGYDWSFDASSPDSEAEDRVVLLYFFNVTGGGGIQTISVDLDDPSVSVFTGTYEPGKVGRWLAAAVTDPTAVCDLRISNDDATGGTLTVHRFNVFVNGTSGYMGHFNLSSIRNTPNFGQIHLGDYSANIATSGPPDWRPCCSHG